jgi:D-alanyl-D-alanine carboxypeptidase/D-alanyl-D-alanine-endopeptidase (penicillin-binding protein 4)
MPRVLILLGVLTLASCSIRARVFRDLAAAENKLHDHTGFVLYDPVARKTLLDFNGNKYFTPASNTKIFTFYTALQLLRDSVPALKYSVRNDSLVFWGTGDPGFLYDHVFDNRRTFDFLATHPNKLFFSSFNFQTEQFGPGWAWDDFRYAYSAERSPFPVYGNLVRITQTKNKLTLTPAGFARDFASGDSTTGKSDLVRDLDSNEITFNPGRTDTARHDWRLPFHYSADLVADLLSDTLKRQVEELNLPIAANARVLYSLPLDSLLRVMMQESDNFIAEQLLLLCSGQLSDTLKPEIAIRYSKEHFLADLPDEPVWIDGSGLSRYNLFTPRSIVRLWEKIALTIPRERLFKLLPVGGRSGTLTNSYRADPPFIFGKTGSLSNNQALSGFLVTRKKRVLIFCFMNGNFTTSSREVRNMMQRVLFTIRDNY